MTHKMLLLFEHDGAERWICPQCGREIVIESYDPWKRTVIEPGDETVGHAGARGGLIIGGVEVTQDD